jgi:NodT family efflux transporter outer membrane factor (OMF) lipoprotein
MTTLTTFLKNSTREYLRPEVAAFAATSGMAIAAAVMTAVLLTGCASGIVPSGKLIEPQALETTKTFSDVAASPGWPARDWWTAYNDPELNKLVAEALASSPDLRQAEARMTRANAFVETARGAGQPSLSANASAVREKFTENYIYPPPLGGSTYTTTILSLNFAWDLDFWGKNRAAIAAANANVNAASADHAAAELALATSVTRSWFQLERLYLLHDVIEQSIRQRQDILKLTTQRVTAGLDTNVELRQAEAGLPQAKLDLMQVEEAMDLTRNQLAALLGQGPDRGRSIPRPATQATIAMALPANMPAEFIGRRADVVAARWRVEAAARNIDNAKAQFYPNVNLAAAVGLISLEDRLLFKTDSLDESAGPALSLPIFQTSLRANLRSRDAEYDAAVEAYNATVIDSVKDVADQIASIRSILRQQGEEALALEKTEQAYALARQRYEAGLGNYLTVLTAETIVLQQRRADAELKARVLDTNVQLVRALGGGFVATPALAQASPSMNSGASK